LLLLVDFSYHVFRMKKFLCLFAEWFPEEIGIDSLNFRIQVFDPDGKYISSFGSHGDGIGEFSNPKGISLDSDGNIYVADAIFDAIQIFNQEGSLLLSIGSTGQGPGEFWIPVSIFIDHTDRIFISDSYNKRVQVFKYLRKDAP
jgi:DNA-binding beta-propeller fold protein YncE